MRIAYDQQLPFIQELFSELGELHPFDGHNPLATLHQEAEILLVRTITTINNELINTLPKLKFIGTASIGTNHIDKTLLQQCDIPLYSAPGCNADAVVEYCLSALATIEERYNMDIRDKTIGIIGVGEIGSRLQKICQLLKINTITCDPPRAERGDEGEWLTIEEVASQADVLTFHVPYITEGQHQTHHLFNSALATLTKPGTIIINSCRGSVVDTNTIYEFFNRGHHLPLVFDVWENEPFIDQQLLPLTELATPHIAGHSIEGKTQAVFMLYEALCKKFSLVQRTLSIDEILPKPDIAITINKAFDWPLYKRLNRLAYDIRTDDAWFRQNLPTVGFNQLRAHYPIRRELKSLLSERLI